MVDAQTARRIVRSLPDVEDLSSASALRFEVRGKQFAWTYLERLDPRRPRQPRIDVLAIRCRAEEKEGLLASSARKFFTVDHYRNFPAILVRLAEVDEAELKGLLTAAWHIQAPRSLSRLLDD